MAMFDPFRLMPVGTVTIVIHHLGTASERGDNVLDPSAPTSDETIDGCIAASGASTDTPLPRQGVKVRWTVYVPASMVPITHSDLVSLPGIDTRYHLIGDPAVWPTPDGVTYRVLQLIDQKG